MHWTQSLLLVYALLMAGGGIAGYTKAGSKPSLVAGLTSAVLVLVALAITFSNRGIGVWAGAVVAGLLCLVFLLRLSKTKKFMPSGMLLLVSATAAAALIVGGLEGTPS